MSTGKRLSESTWLKALGIELSPVSHRERLVSALGGFLAIFLVYAVSKAMLDDGVSTIMLFSMGGSAGGLPAASSRHIRRSAELRRNRFQAFSSWKGAAGLRRWRRARARAS